MTMRRVLGRFLPRRHRAPRSDATAEAGPPNLLALLEQVTDAQDEYERTQDRRALAAAVTAWEQVLAHPTLGDEPASFRIGVLSGAGEAYARRYRAAGDPADLETGLRHWRAALTVASPDATQRADCLNNLGTGLRLRYQHFRQHHDLDEAIVAFSAAVAAAPSGTSEQAWYRSNLGSALQERWANAGTRDDLEAALTAFRQALAGTGEAVASRPGVLNGLGIALRAHYGVTGAVDDLEQAIQVDHEALAATPVSSPNRAVVLNNFGNDLRERYAVSGELEDLDGAIAAYSEAVGLLASESSSLPGYLSNLGGARLRRYHRTGNLDDLEQAVETLRDAVVATAETAASRPLFLTVLGNALEARFTRLRDASDLDEALTVYQEAVDRTPEGSPDRPAYLTNLGSGLSERFAHRHTRGDLDRAIVMYRAAVDTAPPGSPEFYAHLNNLGGGFWDRYAITDDLDNLTRAVGAYRQAVAAAPDGSPDLAACQNNLGNALAARYRRTRDPADLADGVAAYRESCRRGLEAGAEYALEAARNWGRWAAERGDAWSEAIEAGRAGRDLLHRLFRTQLLRSQKESWLREGQGVHTLAAYALFKEGEHEEAAVTLEQGRALLLSEALERDRADLARLADLGRGELLERYRRAAARAGELERAELAPGRRAISTSQRASMLRMAGQELDKSITAIRQVPGYERFLEPPTLADVQAAAGRHPLVYLAAGPAGGLGLIINGSEPVMPVPLPGLIEGRLRIRVERFQEAYRRRSTDSALWLGTLDAVTAWSWGAVMAPVLGEIAAAEQATLVPVGLLGLLPLHAAWTPDADRPTGRRYALDVLGLSYAPNARALAAARTIATQVAAGSLLAVDEPRPVAAPPLPFSGSEVAAAVAHFPVDRVEVLAHESATADRLLERLGDYAVSHFSCHGMAYPAAPLNSALLLAGRPLTLREVLEQRLTEAPGGGRRLAVLSACETGQPGRELPDEVVSLPTGLLHAGLAGVIGTQWAVPGPATAMLMTRFYDLWRRKRLEPVQALRRAQQWVRDTTNEEKVGYFTAAQDTAAMAGGSGAGVAALRRVARRKPATERSYAPPSHWAAFGSTGS